MRDNTELNVITAVVVGFCALGLTSSIWPAVEHTAGITFGVIFGLGGLAVLGYIVREVRRELLFRAEMRAFDRRDAARAAASGHTPSTVGGGRR
ncbi:hypothetical protein [Pseudonocardia sp. 73-21]|uniref:hypothetical protein n=1 Tax=Pseudonocardia sp. 73-21 TaxID=1895809 RepID=UPI00261DB6C7|nr:hypothetical protein [Pseudonocardia sp. 73-21]